MTQKVNGTFFSSKCSLDIHIKHIISYIHIAVEYSDFFLKAVQDISERAAVRFEMGSRKAARKEQGQRREERGRKKNWLVLLNSRCHIKIH